MRRLRKLIAALTVMAILAIAVGEAAHFRRFGHLVVPGLHADMTVTESDNIFGVKGIAKIYDATLTNFGLFPATISACEYQDGGNGGLPAIMINYIVERRRSPTEPWKLVPEWDDYGSRLFCVPSFEVAGTHRVRRGIWPGQSLRVGQVVPAQTGFAAGDDGRFTIFLGADGNASNSIPTTPFRVEKP